MKRRDAMSWMGIGSTGLWATGALMAGTTGQASQESQNQADAKHTEHLKVMTACILACNETVHHSLAYLAGDHAENREHAAKVHQLAMDCQDTCTVTAQLMARHSPVVKPLHQACAEVCAACATECEKSHNDMIKKCAEACRACEKLCKECCAA